MIVEGLGAKVGGQDSSVRGLSKSLFDLGVDVDVLAGRSFFSNHHEKVHNQKYTIREFRYIGRLKISIDLLVYVFKNHKKYSHIHINGLWTFIQIFGIFAAIIARKPIVLSPRGMGSVHSIRRSWLRRIYFKFVQVRLMNLCRVIHATSKLEAADLKRYGVRAPISVIPNGFDKLPRSLNCVEINHLRKAKRQICFVGRICRFKNVDQIIRAFSEVIDRDASWKLKIAGPVEDQIYWQEIQSLIQRKGMEENVLYLGVLGKQELSNLYTESSCLVCCSESENFGLSIVEGLYFGMPAIHPVESPWTSIQSRHLFPVSSLEDVGAALRMILLGGYHFTAEDFEGCISISEPFNWTSHARQMIEVYSNCKLPVRTWGALG
jgi:glycosyltransferase involved in cell wall biosynthesis